MYWVGVRYRGIALPDIMNIMRIWLDQRRLTPNSFEVEISGSGTLVCVEFTQEAETAEFAKFDTAELRTVLLLVEFTESAGLTSSSSGITLSRLALLVLKLIR